MLTALAFYGVTFMVAKYLAILNLGWPVMNTNSVWYPTLVNTTTMLFVPFLLLSRQILPQVLVGLFWGVDELVDSFRRQVPTTVV